MAKIRFEVECKGANKVFLAGTFNDWDTTVRRMKRIRKSRDVFVTILDLPPATYEYKFIVDGEWVCCPDSPRVANEVGGENSVLEVTEDT